MTATAKKPSGKALRAYITEHIDEAIERGYIRVYYQPVVRTITGEVCGLEALARWDDPLYGLLAPDEFIGALEKGGLIHKLDICVIQKICSDYAGLIKADRNVVTVSFNLSRLDFTLCDIHEEIEQAISKNRVPRDALRIEITESTMEGSEERLHEVIDSFWDRGLRVWMDDFGSGYSSLNVLKDYHFDTLKIDMLFMRNFNARSREIVRSVVDMSKRIGVHTLAEGVETQEQFEFLRSIGCEKAQGYYIGKPMPYDECMEHLKNQGYRLESPAKRQYYHDIGSVNVLGGSSLRDSDKNDELSQSGQTPLAIVEYSEGQIRYLFANELYMQTLEGLGIASTALIEREFEKNDTPLREKFLAMIEKAAASSDVVSADFFRNGSYCYCRVRPIASFAGGRAFLCTLHNLSQNTLMSRQSSITDHLQNLCTIYERISLFDLNTGTIENIYHSGQTRGDYNELPLSEELRRYAKSEVYPEDQKGFLEFTEVETLEQRILDSRVRHISAPFRVRSTGGSYAWSLYTILFSGEPSERKLLICFRRLSGEAVARLYGEGSAPFGGSKVSADNSVPPELLWQNFCRNSDTGFFWKDKNRRFLGVNKKFLDYYGLDSEDVLVGKTDEDIGWHIDPEPYKQDEERILSTGEQTYLVPGTCICRGEIRNIVASKFPLYRDGEIVGLMGYFIDMTDWMRQTSDIGRSTLIDPATGTLNILGLMESLLRYQDRYITDGTDFAVIEFDIDHFHLFAQNYGSEWCNKLLREITKKLIQIVGVEGVAGRLTGDHFLIAGQFSEQSQLDGIIRRVNDEVGSIRSVDDIPCTIYLLNGFARFSESEELQKTFALAEERLHQA